VRLTRSVRNNRAAVFELKYFKAGVRAGIESNKVKFLVRKAKVDLNTYLCEIN
jgi:hypothetical protein